MTRSLRRLLVIALVAGLPAAAEGQPPTSSAEGESVPVGGLLGLIPDYYDDCEECHDSLYASIAVGAGVGLLVDFLRIDRRPASPALANRGVHVSIAPSGFRVHRIMRWD